MSTEFMFDGNYIPLHKNGTFGWTKLTYVGEVKEKKQAGPSFGLMAPGYLWIDDVAAGEGRPRRPSDRQAGPRRRGVADRAARRVPADAVRCPECGYRNGAWKTCYACGAAIGTGGGAIARRSPPVKPIATFEDGNPFSGGVVVEGRAPKGARPCGSIGRT